MCRFISIQGTSFNPVQLRPALDKLERGEPVVVPTETVYGLACRPDIPGAVERVFSLKGRPDSKPLPRMVASIAAVRAQVCRWPEAAERLATRFWPGPLTLVLDAPGNTTLAFRIPDHPVLLALLRACPQPLAVTSANRSGEKETHTATDAGAALGDADLLILDAGPSAWGCPSTIVDLSGVDGAPRILREGAIDREQIERAIDASGHPGLGYGHNDG